MLMAQLCLGCMQKNNGEKVCPICGFNRDTVQNAPFMPLGTELQDGNYIVGKKLSGNAESAKYIGFSKTMGTKVIISEFMPAGICGRANGKKKVVIRGGYEEQFQKLNEEFLSYYRSVARLRELSAIAPIFDIFSENGVSYTVAEYYDSIPFTEYINRMDPTKAHPEWHTGNLEKDIYTYLTSKQLDPEMTQDQYKNLMIWHRGLAVPAARNTTTDDFKKGKELFSQIGCAACHRPSWQTGSDNIQDPNKLFTNADMPRYPNQKIWPYTDFVQHRLWMKNDIRTGWCRTTPLWGRGLAGKTGSGVERLHDCRARNVLEAIMWHGCKNEGGTSDAYNTVVKFRNLTKKEREQLIYFIESI